MSVVKRKIVNELHKPARRNFLRRKTILKGLNDLWQGDLADMQKYSAENDGYRYILVVIDCYSKYAWTVPVKNKTGKTITEAMKNILENTANSPKNLQTDLGTEFYNKTFLNLMKQYKINHYSTFSTKKCSFCERLIRSLHSWIHKEFHIRGNYEWVDVLQKITSKYNNTKHSVIKMKPVDVKASTEIDIYKSKKQYKKLKAKFKCGDVVRISKYKSIFEKGYVANFTTELFKIVKVKSTYPITYNLQDIKGNNIEGAFYENELIKTKYPDSYLVERIIKRKGDQILVKWLGFSSENNSWININDIV